MDKNYNKYNISKPKKKRRNSKLHGLGFIPGQFLQSVESVDLY